MHEDAPRMDELCNKIRNLQDFALISGISAEQFLELWTDSPVVPQKKNRSSVFLWILGLTAVALSVLWGIITCTHPISKCLIHNNFAVKEMTRPVADCTFCKGLEGILVLHNVTKDTFKPLAYSSKPMLVKEGCHNWSALQTFSYEFFRELYSNRPDALRTVEEHCQFFSFNTRFFNLEQVLQMTESEAKMQEGPWYIGWSNCDPEVADILRHHYDRPHFLPDSSEASAIDWIFMGGEGRGASMHLDYVHRPSWQAQVSGTKTWTLIPVPECESVCKATTFTTEKGDIVLINTNQWYHDTFIHPGEISISIGSEYD